MDAFHLRACAVKSLFSLRLCFSGASTHLNREFRGVDMGDDGGCVAAS